MSSSGIHTARYNSINKMQYKWSGMGKGKID
jgi:hypothetical protein